jgi:hypothetical protein
MFRAELIEPGADDLTDAIGFAVYSNSKPTINYLPFFKKMSSTKKKDLCLRVLNF